MPTNKLPMAENPDYSFDGAWRDVSGRQHVAFTNRGRPFRAFVPGVGTAANDVSATPTVESVKVWSKNGRVAVDVFSLSQVNNAYPGMGRTYWRPV